MFGITFRSRTRTAKSNEQLENGCLLVKFWKPFVNLFLPSDGRGNFGAFSTCSRRKNHFPYRTRKIPNSATSVDHAAGARSKNSAANHSTFQKTSELFSIGGGHVVPVVNNTTCFSIYKWLLFLLLFSSYFPLLSHSFLK